MTDAWRSPAADAETNPATQPVAVHGEQFTQHPAELYQRIRREHGSVAPIVLEGGVRAWFVLGYREVRFVTEHPQLFDRDAGRWNAWDTVPVEWPLPLYVAPKPTTLLSEGVQQRRRAEAMSDALAAVDLYELELICERVADERIDALSGRGEADLVAEYTQQIPLRVMAHLFGFPEAEVPAHVEDIARSLTAGQGASDVCQRTADRMRRLVVAKRETPGLDVPSRLLGHASTPTAEEIAADLLAVAAACQQPTANWMGNTLRLLLTDDRFALTLLCGRRGVSEALNEVLWDDAPIQNVIGRWATRDTEVAGQPVRAGDLLVLGLAAANTDPQVRTIADMAENQAHLSFGGGAHSCPYPAPALAETIARTAIEVLLDRLPDIDLAVPADELEWDPSVCLHGLRKLPVTFTPAPLITRM